ncbi:MAG: acyl carrier protein [Neolewinella sp.]|jgi:acyl carrier protein
MQDLTAIQNKVKACIIEVLDLSDLTPDSIDNTTPFFGTEEEPGIIQDSLAILEISTVLGEEFGIMPTEFDEESFHNVEALSLMIQKSLAAEDTLV